MTTLTSIKQSAIEDTGFSVGLTSAQATAIAEERGLVVYATPANLPSVGVNEGSLALVKSNNSFYIFIDTSWQSIQLDHDWSLNVDELKITASDLQVSDYFGFAVAISSDGNYVIVSAYAEDGGAGDPISAAGAAYIFTRSGSSWTEQAILRASDAQASDDFGYSVSINSDGTYAIVGAYREDGGAGDPTTDAGAAYVFTRSGSTWTEQTILRASDAATFDYFGFDVSINSDGTYAIVGAYLDGGSADPKPDAGAAYVFTRSGSTWTEQAKLTASDIEPFAWFGINVSMNNDGSYVVIGARQANNDTGAAYIFTRSGSTWTEQQILRPLETVTRTDYFGASVAINGSGDVVVVGSDQAEDDDVPLNSGFAYIFTRSGSTWKQEDRLESPAGENSSGDAFGTSVAINNTGNVIAVGATFADTGASNAGALYAFNRSPSNTWTYSRELTAADAAVNDYLSGTERSVAISGDGKYIIGGARIDDHDGILNTGSAYIFNVV